MASPELAIAKAALSASLFRADPVAISRPDVDSFLDQIDSTLLRCSRPNVQKCKSWIAQQIAPSPGRSSALAKYFVALSKSQAESDTNKKPSCKRRRLHVLYIVSDLLHHVLVEQRNQTYAQLWHDATPKLVASAAAFSKCPKHIKKLETLLDIWEERNCFSTDVIAKLRKAIAGEQTTDETTLTSTTSKLSEDLPYMLPSFHGDASMPWYDLPASTWLPHMIPNSMRPIVPGNVKPIQMTARQPSKTLVSAVQQLLANADKLYNKSRGTHDDKAQEVNELGETVTIDEVTGEVLDGFTYYGWSRQFCKNMKKRKHQRQPDTRSRSQSLSPSRKRPRSRSPSRDSTPSRRNRSRSRSRSRTPGRWRKHQRSYSRSRSRSPSRPRFGDAPSNNSFVSPTNFPHPPPPPPNFQGKWPPPPPFPQGNGPPPNWVPDPAMMAQFAAVGGQFPLPPPPPPPPPPPQHRDGHQNWHGNDRDRYRGRGQ